jgi:tetratricopeptide (TPR) repeat protein
MSRIVGLRRILGLALAGLLLSGCVGLRAAPLVEPRAMLQPPRERALEAIAGEGAEAFGSGRWADAERAYAELARRRPSAAAQFDLALAVERQGRLAEALGHYEAVLVLEAGHRPTLLALGRVQCGLGRPEAAITLYEGARRDPALAGDAELTANLAIAYRQAGRLDEAEATARSVLFLGKESASAYQTLALVAHARGRDRLAEVLASQALRIDGRAPTVHNTLGLIALGLGEAQRAQRHFEQALALDARFAPALSNLGELLLSFRDYQGAERHLRALAELEPTAVAPLIALGWALDGQKRADPKKAAEAGTIFERALGLDPQRGEALCGAAWAFSTERSTWERALRYFERCRASPTTAEEDRVAIDAKVRGLRAMTTAGEP